MTGSRSKSTVLAILLAGMLAGGLTGCFSSIGVTNVENQAAEAAVKSDLANAKLAVVTYLVDNNGVLPTSASVLTRYGFTPDKTTVDFELHVSTSGDGRFCVQGSTKSGVVFRATDTASVQKGTCIEGAGADY